MSKTGEVSNNQPTPEKASKIPHLLNGDVSQEELLRNMGDLLTWALSCRLGELLAADVKGDELMKLRIIAVRFQKGGNTIADLNYVRSLLPKLEHVRIVATRGSEDT